MNDSASTWNSTTNSADEWRSSADQSWFWSDSDAMSVEDRPWVFIHKPTPIYIGAPRNAFFQQQSLGALFTKPMQVYNPFMMMTASQYSQ